MSGLLAQLVAGAAAVSMALGAFFFLVTAIGMLRLPDAFTRLHAGTKGLTLGVGFLLFGAALMASTWSQAIKTLLIGVFLLITNPIAVHALARANYRLQRSRLRLVIDEYLERKGPGE